MKSCQASGRLESLHVPQSMVQTDWVLTPCWIWLCLDEHVQISFLSLTSRMRHFPSSLW